MTKRDYRIYKINEAGRILGAAVAYAAESDDTALNFAQVLRTDAEGISVWQAGRLVQELGPNRNAGLRFRGAAGVSRQISADVCAAETSETIYEMVDEGALSVGSS